MVDIRQIKYCPNATIKMNLGFKDDEWVEFPWKIKLRHQKPTQLYNEQLKISYNKWKHLQEIKETIPLECHKFYDELPHHSK